MESNIVISAAVSDVARFITSNAFIAAYIGLILLIFLIVLVKFHWRVRPLREALSAAYRVICGVRSMNDFAAEFPDIDDRMSEDGLLKHPWGEFKETLLFPGQDLGNDSEHIFNTHPASFFFSRESIVAPKLNLRFYNAFPGILTAMGILGTFIGLVAGIYLASDGLAADDINKAKLALENLLSGASLAFSTSIAGLFTSMVASFSEKRQLHLLDAQVENFVIALDDRVQRLPAEKIQASILIENQQQTKALQSFTNDLAVKFAEVLEDKISKPMGDSMDLVLESLELLRTEQAKASDEMISKLVSEFSQSISGAAGNEMNAFAATLNTLNDVFTEQISSAAKSQEQTYALLQEATEAIRACVKEVAVATEKNHALVSEANHLLSTANQAQAELAQTVAPLRGLAETMMESSRNGIEVAGIMKDCSTDLTSSVENLVEMQDLVSSVWRDYQERFENVDEQLASSFIRLKDGLQAYSENLSDYLQKLESETAKVVTHLAGGTKGLEEAVGELADVMSQRETN